MARQLDCWITSFQEYLKESEAPPVFAKWGGIMTVVAALRKKVWFKFGKLKTYPNIYCILVGPPATGKGIVINAAREFIQKNPDIKITADSTTREALLQVLEESSDQTLMPDNTNIRHSSILVVSNEFEVFLGQKKENMKLLADLTDLFDCPEGIWEYRTKGKGRNRIYSPMLSILGGTTSSSLALSLPPSAIGGGFTTRVVFVYFGHKYKRQALWDYTPEMKELEKKLHEDLIYITQIRGEYYFSPTAKKEYTKWYESFNPLNKICNNRIFDGWYERKHVMCHKTAMALKASRGDDMEIDWDTYQEAISLVEELEPKMELAFRSVGRSEYVEDVDMLVELIKSVGCISRMELMDRVWQDIDTVKFDIVMNTALGAGLVKKVYCSKCMNTVENRTCECDAQYQGFFYCYK